MVIFQSEDPVDLITDSNKREVIVYDNSNIQKSCSGVTTPLTFNFTRRAYSIVFEETQKHLSLARRSFSKDPEIFQNLVGLIKGRIYYNINNWYRGFRYFNSLNHNRASLVQIMGLSEPVNFVDKDIKTLWQKGILIWDKCINLPKLLLSFRSLKNTVPRFLERLQLCFTNFYSKDLSSLSLEGLKLEKGNLDSRLLKLWVTPIVNDLYILTASANIARQLEKAGLNNPDEFVNSFLTEEQALASMKPAKHLHNLALEAAYYPELKVLISRLPDDIHGQVEIRFKEFYQQVNEFIDVYGDTAAGELKLETQTMRSNPSLFYSYLRDCLTAQISDIRAGNSSQQIAMSTLERKLSNLPAIHKSRILSKVNKLRQAISHRELFKLERSRVFGMYRSLYIAFGVKFQQKEWIGKPEDIFYLTEDEILSCENGMEHVFDTLIATRKQEFEQYKSEVVPSRVMVLSKIVNPVVPEVEHVPLIQGFDSEEIKAEVA